MARIYIGVDVCKEYLDAATRPATTPRRFTNDAEGIAQLVAWATELQPERIVFESTGSYQKAALGALLGARLPAVVVNAR
jgi:transposase